ncbi:hypothetical protein EVAR_90612_1 [Eumeta japonica]|uniref:Uncharacterized protein n=1 Tax=Eumeta variegata TaxID=151549 RepID=A0A4C1YRW6_EUMVA|nr:hypothetical protein EVAR_90612_1 [Eumeta japonica]
MFRKTSFSKALSSLNIYIRPTSHSRFGKPFQKFYAIKTEARKTSIEYKLAEHAFHLPQIGLSPNAKSGDRLPSERAVFVFNPDKTPSVFEDFNAQLNGRVEIELARTLKCSESANDVSSTSANRISHRLCSASKL